MNTKTLVDQFEQIRDLPYKISLSWDEEQVDDKSCTGKNKMLMSFLEENGYDVRWRICSFLWSGLDLPDHVQDIPHDNEATHAFLEVKLEGKWCVVDTTWDIGLSKVLPIATWDGKTSTKLAVPAKKYYNPEESVKFMQNENQKIFEEDMEKNKLFYQAINNWFEELRKIV